MGSVSGEIKAGCPEASSLRLYLAFFFFSASRCRNIHYMHEEFSLAACIDPASPIPQHVLITSTVFFFLKSVMRRTLCQVSCQTQVCMMLRSNQHGLSFCLFPPLQIYCVETCNILFSWINLSRHSSHISSVILYSHYKKYSFRLKQKPHLNTSSLFEEDGSTVVYTGYLSHLAQFLQNKWHLFIWFLILWRSCCHVHQQTQGGIVSSHLTDWLTCYQSALACFLIWSVI